MKLKTLEELRDELEVVRGDARIGEMEEDILEILEQVVLHLERLEKKE